MTLPGLRCACGSADVVLIAPGSLPEYAPGTFPVHHGVPITARCLACWPVAAQSEPEPAKKPPKRTKRT